MSVSKNIKVYTSIFILLFINNPLKTSYWPQLLLNSLHPLSLELLDGPQAFAFVYYNSESIIKYFLL